MLRGRVCNGKGEAAAGATIEMSDADGERVAAFVSGDDGCFTSEVDEVTAGDYSLLLTCEGYPEQAVPATVTEGMTLLEVPLLPDPTSSIGATGRSRLPCSHSSVRPS